jgi:hypothetical protein
VGEAAYIASLLSWDAYGNEPEAAYARLRANPRYCVAVQTFARNMLAEAKADPALDGILKDAGRNVAAKCLAYPHVTGGLTLPPPIQSGLMSPPTCRSSALGESTREGRRDAGER